MTSQKDLPFRHTWHLDLHLVAFGPVGICIFGLCILPEITYCLRDSVQEWKPLDVKDALSTYVVCQNHDLFRLFEIGFPFPFESPESNSIDVWRQ
ncbi:hypothetical protein E4T56_gene6868 [Termitomyces sp. T112]|nr:hypothetical protein E4T56_gene6868 [Termitomyces sp. T112]